MEPELIPWQVLELRWLLQEGDETLMEAFFFSWGSSQRGMTAQECLLAAVTVAGVKVVIPEGESGWCRGHHTHKDLNELLLTLGLDIHSRLLPISVYSSLTFILKNRDLTWSKIINSRNVSCEKEGIHPGFSVYFYHFLKFAFRSFLGQPRISFCMVSWSDIFNKI